MEEFKGTKGEWKLKIGTPNPLNSNCTQHIVHIGENASYGGIVDVWSSDHHVCKTFEESLANAQIIAAAPELLKLCLLVYKSFGGGPVITFSEKDIEDFERITNKALGK